MVSKLSDLIKCKKCGNMYGEWDYRKVKGLRYMTCKACEAETKANRIRRKQESGADNHLMLKKVHDMTAHEWERKAMARANDNLEPERNT